MVLMRPRLDAVRKNLAEANARTDREHVHLHIPQSGNCSPAIVPWTRIFPIYAGPSMSRRTEFVRAVYAICDTDFRMAEILDLLQCIPS
jgi:hypothetical protein